MYHIKCPICDDSYMREVERRLGEYVCDHSDKHHKSHMLNHSNEKA